MMPTDVTLCNSGINITMSTDVTLHDSGIRIMMSTDVTLCDSGINITRSTNVTLRDSGISIMMSTDVTLRDSGISIILWCQHMEHCVIVASTLRCQHMEHCDIDIEASTLWCQQMEHCVIVASALWKYQHNSSCIYIFVATWYRFIFKGPVLVLTVDRSHDALPSLYQIYWLLVVGATVPPVPGWSLSQLCNFPEKGCGGHETFPVGQATLDKWEAVV